MSLVEDFNRAHCPILRRYLQAFTTAWIAVRIIILSEVAPETSKLLHIKFEPRTSNVLVYLFLLELSEKHSVGDVVFLVDG